MFKFSNVTELQVIAVYDTNEGKIQNVQQMIKERATKCQEEKVHI
jgi:hypothetical protein